MPLQVMILSDEVQGYVNHGLFESLDGQRFSLQDAAPEGLRMRLFIQAEDGTNTEITDQSEDVRSQAFMVPGVGMMIRNPASGKDERMHIVSARMSAEPDGRGLVKKTWDVVFRPLATPKTLKFPGRPT